MREALPYAVGVALSPVPIAAILLLLTTRRATTLGLAFLVGWLVGVAAVAAALVLVVGGASVDDSDSVWIALGELLVGAAFLLAALALWSRRDRRSAFDRPWVSTVDSFTTLRSAGLGLVLSGGNPKVVGLSLGVALALAEAGASTSTAAAGVAVFTVVGAVGVVAPIAAYAAVPARAESLLRQGRDWLERHERIVLVVLGVLIGTLFLADGVVSL